MSRLRPRLKPLLVLAAAAALAVSLSACAAYKHGSLQVSQPGGIGDVRVHFELCTDPSNEGCQPNEEEGQSQYLLVFSVPNGTAAPASITAAPVGGGAPIVYSRNDEVARSFDAAAQAFSEQIGEPYEWPPAGSEGIGYLSSVFTEEKDQVREWTVDADFGLPVPADGSPFGGPFELTMASGWREVSETAPADRPVECYRPGEMFEERHAACAPNEEEPKRPGTADLRIGAASAVKAFVGGKATISFPFNFAATVSPPPGFSLAATSTLGKAKLKLSNPSFFPTALDPTPHRAPADTRAVVVTIPKNAKAGSHDVTLTATAGQGGTVSQVAKLKVTKPKLKFGGVKLNKAKGTATLSVKVPGAGTLTVGGKGVVKAKKKAKKAKRLKLTVRASGKAAGLLDQLGEVRVKAKIAFKPSSGIAVKKTKAITLKKN